jgi:endonuclease III
MPNLSAPSGELVQKARRIYALLVAHYGVPLWNVPEQAVDELVSTILSQNTNDRNRDMAYHRLRDRFPTWEEVLSAPVAEVIEAVRPAGLANQKGARLQEALRQIFAERGSFDLTFLRGLPAEEAHAWLRKFKGVGPKTASIVLVFALGIPAFPVDTHVHRVSGRLGLRPEKMNEEQTHTWMEALFAPETYGPAHMNLIRLGREICHARKPQCERCPLALECDYFQRLPG